MLFMPVILCQPDDMNSDESTRIVIRQASADDAESIASIYAACVRSGTATFDTVPPSTFETEDKIAKITSKGWPFLVAARGADVVGYAYITLFRDRAAYGFTCENSIYVRSDQADKGVGTTLMHALIDSSTQCGFRQMMAVIGGGEPASVALHAKMGFEHAGRMRSVGRKFGRWLDTVYMQLELGEGERVPPDTEPY